MGMLGEKFPETQFVITGVLGPSSNAHGPNEFLEVRRLSACAPPSAIRRFNRQTHARSRCRRALHPRAMPTRKWRSLRGSLSLHTCTPAYAGCLLLLCCSCFSPPFPFLLAPDRLHAKVGRRRGVHSQRTLRRQALKKSGAKRTEGNCRASTDLPNKAQQRGGGREAERETAQQLDPATPSFCSRALGSACLVNAILAPKNLLALAGASFCA
jgi:hypothetical protein